MVVSHPIHFKSYDPSFEDLLGDNPEIHLFAEDKDGNPLFHEACVYHAPSRSIFVTSNQIPRPLLEKDDSTRKSAIRLSRVYDGTPPGSQVVEDVTPAGLSFSMLNGGVNFDDSSILLCAQGCLDTTKPSGIVRFHVRETSNQPDETLPTWHSIVSSFHGRQFNSVNDVVVHPHDKSIWFTDPSYGFHQGFRPAPQLPDQVYRYEPMSNSIRAMANGFKRCNGLCFSPAADLLYVTDTGAAHGDSKVPFDLTGESHIYVFDIHDSNTGGPFLSNRRMFAFADGCCPDGIKCDEAGNVYSGCGDGVEVWNPRGTLIGRILVPGGVSNFCFGEKGCLYLCNETKIWKIQLHESVRGALLGV